MNPFKKKSQEKQGQEAPEVSIKQLVSWAMGAMEAREAALEAKEQELQMIEQRNNRVEGAGGCPETLAVFYTSGVIPSWHSLGQAFNCLGHHTRLMIFKHLHYEGSGGALGSELMEATNTYAAMLNQHLAVMIRAELVVVELTKDKGYKVYHLADNPYVKLLKHVINSFSYTEVV